MRAKKRQEINPASYPLLGFYNLLYTFFSMNSRPSLELVRAKVLWKTYEPQSLEGRVETFISFAILASIAVKIYYSYLSARMGIMVAARNAGYRPEIMPINVEKINANSGSQTGV